MTIQYYARQCTCEPTCTRWYVEPFQRYTRDQAESVAALLNMMELESAETESEASKIEEEAGSAACAPKNQPTDSVTTGARL